MIRLAHCSMAAILIAACAATQLSAISGGQADTENLFANVGAIIVDGPGGPLQLCSGTLIHKRGFLTASHCTAFLEFLIDMEDIEPADVYVTFSQDDPLNSAHWIPVTDLFTHPDFTRLTSPNTHDIAIIELAWDVDDIPLASLAPVGYLDQLRTQGLLRKKENPEFIVVGYGLVRSFPLPFFDQPGGIQRRFAFSGFQTLLKHELQLNAVQASGVGNGGTCFGDSGGPGFWIENETAYLTSVTSWGDVQCVASDRRYRVDTLEVHQFIEAVLMLIGND